MQMVEVKLLGELGKRFGRKHRFMANSARDVFSALSNQLEGFKDYFCNAHEKGIGFKLVDGDPDGMDYGNVLMGCRRLIIAPVISGSGAVGRILIGVALIALAFIPIAGQAAFAGFVGLIGMALVGIYADVTPKARKVVPKPMNLTPPPQPPPLVVAP